MIPNYATIAEPLFDLTKKNVGQFVWTPEANEAFNILKDKLTTAPVLAYSDMNIVSTHLLLQ